MQSPFMLISRNNFKHIAANTKRSAVKIVIIPRILHFHQTFYNLIHADTLPLFNRNDQLGVKLRRTKSVNA